MNLPKQTEISIFPPKGKWSGNSDIITYHNVTGLKIRLKRGRKERKEGLFRV